MLARALTGIFSVNLGVRKSERVLVFTDRVTKRETVAPEDLIRREKLRDITNLASEVGRKLCREIVTVEYQATGSHGKEPPRRLWEAAFGEKAVGALEREGLLRGILNKKADETRLKDARKIILACKAEAVDAVIALSNYSTSHTRFRDFLTNVCGARYASMPLFDFRMLEGAMNVDWKALARRTKGVAALVSKAVSVRLRAPNGTDITMSLKGRKAHADTGLITKAGGFGNLPAGEAYIAPLEGTAEGTMVLEWAPTRELSSPVTIKVSRGFVEEVSGEDVFAGELEARLYQRRENRNIAELGIGTNEMARRPDNILESEKILGTVHVALGDNSSFGGTVKTPFHQDFVFFRPTLELHSNEGGSEILIEEGRLKAGG